ncbi:MAG TPA: hypothetical protein VGI66_03540 [Streptosporangiaceae bacterium]|jgi:hypothetical protein
MARITRYSRHGGWAVTSSPLSWLLFGWLRTVFAFIGLLMGLLLWGLWLVMKGTAVVTIVAATEMREKISEYRAHRA